MFTLRSTAGMALAALVVSLVGCTRPAEEAAEGTPYRPMSAGQPAPAMQVLGTDGRSLPVVSPDSLTLLNLWATWCGPCREEFPDIEQLHRDFAPRGLRVLAVDADADPIPAVLQFAADMEVTFRLAVDTTGSIMDRYKAMGLPSSYLINTEGVVEAMWTGILPASARDTIAAYLPPTP